MKSAQAPTPKGARVGHSGVLIWRQRDSVTQSLVDGGRIDMSFGSGLLRAASGRYGGQPELSEAFCRFPPGIDGCGFIADLREQICRAGSW